MVGVHGDSIDRQGETVSSIVDLVFEQSHVNDSSAITEFI